MERAGIVKRFWTMNRVPTFKISDMGYFRMILRTKTWPCVKGSLSRAEMENLKLKMKL